MGFAFNTNSTACGNGGNAMKLGSVSLFALAAAAATIIGASGPALAGSYTLITPYVSTGTTTQVLGINDAGYMTGSIADASGSALGFSRDPAGVYTTFSAGYATTGRNISNSNSITGYATDATGALMTDTQFQRSAGGVITTLVNPVTSEALHGIAQGQNASGAIVGDYLYASGGHNFRHGYEINGSTFTDIAASTDFRVKTTARGINDAGIIVGWNRDNSTGITQAYVDVGGILTFFSDPNALNANTTYFEDINNNGLVSGEFADAAGLLHPFLFNITTDKFTDLTPPGILDYFAFGLNNAGQVVLTSSSSPDNYLYTPTSTAVPEPAGAALMLFGFGLVGQVLRRRNRTA